jgi:hypothetical protein
MPCRCCCRAASASGVVLSFTTQARCLRTFRRRRRHTARDAADAYQG